MGLSISFSLILLSIIFSSSVVAEHYQLYKSGKPGSFSANYDRMVEQLKSGDTIEFSNGKVFDVHQKFVSGALNAIIDIGNGRVIRIRKMSPSLNPLNIFFNPEKAVASIDSLGEFTEGYKDLKKYGVRIPEVYLDESLKGEYVMIEKININFTYNDFLSNDFYERLSEEMIIKARKDLVEFARSTFAFRYIGDFRADQIHYSIEKGWVLLDWTNQHMLALDNSAGNVFTMDHIDNVLNMEARSGTITKAMILKPKLPEDVKVEALNELYAARKSYIDNYNQPPSEPEKKCPGFFKKLLRFVGMGDD